MKTMCCLGKNWHVIFGSVIWIDATEQLGSSYANAYFKNLLKDSEMKEAVV